MHWWYGAGPDVGWWSWIMPFGMLFWLIAFILVVVGIAWLVQGQSTARVREDETGRQSRAFDVLDERFARGELEREEYLQKRRDLAARTGGA